MLNKPTRSYIAIVYDLFLLNLDIFLSFQNGQIKSAHNLVPFPSKPNMHQSLLFASAAPLNQSEDTADTLSTNQNEMALRKLNFDAIFTFIYKKSIPLFNIIKLNGKLYK